MKKITLTIGIFSLCAFGCSAPQTEETIHFKTGSTQTILLQLFASQGCSSCPPAEKWVTTFKGNKQLWKTIVPVVFHVDYWDNLGWKDPLALKDYTLLQQSYHKQNIISSIYTPCFVVNGKEWRGWPSQKELRVQQAQTGVIEGTLRADMLEMTYTDPSQALELHVAILGSGLETAVKSGENRGKNLVEDFVVLHYSRFVSPDGKWSIKVPHIADTSAGKPAVALWVSRKNDPTPLQATGGWLPQKH